MCQFYPRGTCVKGASCPFRHVRGDRTIVCKHWLRGLCKKGDQCEFLHEYDMTKMPECYFYSRFSKYTRSAMDICILLIIYNIHVQFRRIFTAVNFLYVLIYFHCDITKLSQYRYVKISYELLDACHNKECPFLHIDPETKVRDCPWYDRGFCRHGPLCRHRHVRRVLCMAYLAGFCPDGPTCKFMQ